MQLAILGSRGYPSTYGGFETFVRRLAPWLQQRGHAVTVYGRSSRPRIQRGQVNGVEVVRVPAIDKKALSTISHAIVASEHAKRQGYDCVLAVNVACVPFVERLQRSGCPVVLNVDGMEWTRQKWGPVARTAFYLGARRAARGTLELVADSRAIADFYEMQWGATPIYIPYGADVRTISTTARIAARGLEPGMYALVVARLAPENQVDLILDAFLESSLDIPLVVAGSANYRNSTQVRLESLHESGRVHWLGHVDDQAFLEELWAHTRLYLHGHSAGGTNPALLQALGLGAPTLAFDSPFNREVLAGFNGSSLFPGNRRDLTRLLEDVVAGDVEPIGGDEAQDLVRRRYRWDEVLAEYERVLAHAAEHPGHRPSSVEAGSPPAQDTLQEDWTHEALDRRSVPARRR